MKPSWKELCIALAGTAQTVAQVEQIATTGYVKSEELETAINSLFVVNPESCEQVYGNVGKLLNGLETLQQLLSKYRDPDNAVKLRYILGILHIQKKLSGKHDLLQLIRVRLDQADNQVKHFGSTHDNVIRNIAGIYTDTISKFQYRIQVSGNYNYLQQERVANQIRTLLLAGIRSAILWRQMGGRRWQLLFYRAALLEACDELIREAKQQVHH